MGFIWAGLAEKIPHESTVCVRLTAAQLFCVEELVADARCELSKKRPTGDETWNQKDRFVQVDAALKILQAHRRNLAIAGQRARG